MTTPSLPSSSASTSGWDASGAPGGELPPSAADFALAGRNVPTAQYISGLLGAGQLQSVGTPRKLPQDIWPDVDPALVQAIWDRGAATGFYAGQVYADPERYRSELVRLQERYREAAFEAMGAMVGRSLRLVVPEHPADDEAARSHE